MSPEDAKARLADFETGMSKYGVTLHWKGMHAKIKGLAVSGGIDVDASMVDLTLKLGMMARAAGVDAERLEASITRRLKALFDE
jgi:hypothetical protein